MQHNILLFQRETACTCLGQFVPATASAQGSGKAHNPADYTLGEPGSSRGQDICSSSLLLPGMPDCNPNLQLNGCSEVRTSCLSCTYAIQALGDFQQPLVSPVQYFKKILRIQYSLCPVKIKDYHLR